MLLLLLALSGSVSETAVRDAIVAAVQQRMGAGAEVLVTGLRITSPIDVDEVVATPDPASRLDAPIRFTLRGATGAAGRASAIVRVIVDHAHVGAAVERGAGIPESNLVISRHEISAGPLTALPTVSEAREGKALRVLPAGACLTHGTVAVRPAVQTGEDVVAESRIGGVVVRAQLVAARSGGRGSVIRVVNRQSRRALKARVIEPGLVEIIQ